MVNFDYHRHFFFCQRTMHRLLESWIMVARLTILLLNLVGVYLVGTQRWASEVLDWLYPCLRAAFKMRIKTERTHVDKYSQAICITLFSLCASLNATYVYLHTLLLTFLVPAKPICTSCEASKMSMVRAPHTTQYDASVCIIESPLHHGDCNHVISIQWS